MSAQLPNDAGDSYRPDDEMVDPEDVAALQEAIDDMENGDKGIPLEEFDRAFRARHNIPPRS